jgi:hypothetical protein
VGKKMIPFSKELFNHLSSRITDYGYQTDIRRMFGHEVHFLNGYMFAGANRDGIYVHIGEEAKALALEGEEGVFPFEPLEGMSMREYLLLGPEVYGNDAALKRWLDQSSDFLLSLPPKVKKKGGRA